MVRAKPEVVNIKPARLTKDEAEQKKLQTEKLAEEKKKSDQQLKAHHEAKAKERREVREEAVESLTAFVLLVLSLKHLCYTVALVLYCGTCATLVLHLCYTAALGALMFIATHSRGWPS